MKPHILLFLVLISFSASAQTVFAPRGAVWYYGHRADDPSAHFYARWEVEKDTLYEGHHCAKITGKRYYAAGTELEMAPQYTYVSGDSVFYYNNVFHDFHLLFVFNVKAGDTITYHKPDTLFKSEPDSFRVRVSLDGKRVVDGKTLRYVHIGWSSSSLYSMNAYSECFGTTLTTSFLSAPTEAFWHNTTRMHDDSLRCYTDDDINEKFTHGPSCDYQPTSVPRQREVEPLVLYPNPVSGLLTIGSLAQSCTAMITDVLGHTILTQQLQAAASNSIPVSHLAPGVYYLGIRSTDGAVSGYRKFVKE